MTENDNIRNIKVKSIGEIEIEIEIQVGIGIEEGKRGQAL